MAASLLLALFGIAGALDARRATAMLDTGPAMVVIAPAVPSAEDRESEAYGDYAEYLNGFAAKRPAGLKLVRFNPASYRQLIRQPVLAERHATLFLRRGGQGLVYQGMIIEPQVYDAGARWALGGAMPAAEIGLMPVRVVRRR